MKGSIFLVAAFAVLLSSCTEKLSGVGSMFLRDTITTGTHSYTDSSGFIFRPVIRRTAIAAGQNINLNISATNLLIGKVPNDVESWIALKLPILPDTVGNILTDSLILRMRFPFQYGNPADQIIDFSVKIETNNFVNDSTNSLVSGNLQQVVGTYSGIVSEDSLLTISIPLDTATINKWIRTASLSLVLVPNSAMNTIRWFASNENGDNTYAPTLKCLVSSTASNPDTVTIYRNPTIDFYVVTEDTPPPPTGEFMLRGSYAERERIVINIKDIRNQLQLNPFATINSALLQIRSDSKFHTTSNVPVDTLGPALADLPIGSVPDSGRTFIGYGSNSTADPDLYSFQIRDSVERALRSGEDSIVLELRTGFAFRTFNGSSVDVEDYNINRWFFYGMDYTADITKRPKLIITYSYLR